MDTNTTQSILFPEPIGSYDIGEKTLNLASHSAELALHFLSNIHKRDTSPNRSGNGTLIGGDDHDCLRGSSGDDYLYGGSGRDLLSGASGQDQLIGGLEEDLLVGGDGDDRLFGQAGDDLILGNQGNDSLDGGTGRDRILAGRGSDILIDRDGGDLFSGGQNGDQFWIGEGVLGATQIKDFQLGIDQIKFLELGVTLDQLSLRQRHADTDIFYQGQQLAVLRGVKANDLMPRDFLFGDTTLIEDLQIALDRASEQESPGATLAVVTPDGFVWTGAGGLGDLESQTPMRASERLDVASVTKPMVSVILLQLMQEGRLSLDDTLSQWLPEVSNQIENRETITLRNLLNHTSGIPEYLDEYSEDLKSNPTQSGSPQKFLEYINGKSANFQPGDAYGYSNTNYVLLGLVIEAVTGESLASQLQSRIFEPLSMHDSFYVPQEAVPGGFQPGYTTFFSVNGALEKSPISPTARGFGDGGVVSTATDLSRFIQALVNGELLAPSTVEQMVQDRYSGSDPLADFNYGLGLQQVRLPEGIELWGHTGGAEGSTTQMFYSPNQQFTAVTINNISPGDGVGFFGNEAIAAILSPQEQ
jgi:CubicO group peptidase (beta-lactamase class C family)